SPPAARGDQLDSAGRSTSPVVLRSRQRPPAARASGPAPVYAGCALQSPYAVASVGGSQAKRPLAASHSLRIHSAQAPGIRAISPGMLRYVLAPYVITLSGATGPRGMPRGPATPSAYASKWKVP